jgi:hypothetical protein
MKLKQATKGETSGASNYTIFLAVDEFMEWELAKERPTCTFVSALG